MEEVLEKIKFSAHKDVLSDNVDARREYMRMFGLMPDIQYLVERLANELIDISKNYYAKDDKNNPYMMVNMTEYLSENMDLMRIFDDVVKKENLQDTSNNFETAKNHIRNFLVYGYFSSARIANAEGNPITEDWYSDGHYYISYIETLIRPYNLIRQTEDAFVINRFSDNIYETNVKFVVPNKPKEQKPVDLTDEEKELLRYLRLRFIEVARVPESFFPDWELNSPDADSIVKDYDYYCLRQRIYKHYECWINKMVEAEAKNRSIEMKEPIRISFLAENNYK